MIPLFLGLTLANVLGLATALTLGYMSLARGAVRPYHLLAGALAAILCIAVHSIVFTYFIATAKWIQHAVVVRGLDPALAAPTRSFKAMAFPAALLCMLAVFAAAVMGALHDTYGMSRTVHHLAALGAIVVNLGGAAVEFAAIARNGRLIDEILARIGAAGISDPR